MRSVPLCSEVASPAEETVTSSFWPDLTKGGSVAVTMTAATFLDLKSTDVGTTPILDIRFVIACWVKLERLLSPELLSPTTSPKPINWFSRAPKTWAMSFNRTAGGGAAGPGEKKKKKKK